MAKSNIITEEFAKSLEEKGIAEMQGSLAVYQELNLLCDQSTDPAKEIANGYDTNRNWDKAKTRLNKKVYDSIIFPMFCAIAHGGRKSAAFIAIQEFTDNFTTYDKDKIKDTRYDKVIETIHGKMISLDRALAMVGDKNRKYVKRVADIAMANKVEAFEAKEDQALAKKFASIDANESKTEDQKTDLKNKAFAASKERVAAYTRKAKNSTKDNNKSDYASKLDRAWKVVIAELANVEKLNAKSKVFGKAMTCKFDTPEDLLEHVKSIATLTDK
jgi:cell division septation protein DedD